MSRVDVVVNLMQKNGYQTYAEIGVKQGRMLCSVVRQTGCVGVGVDAWRNLPNEGESYEAWDFEEIRTEYDRNIKGLPIRTLNMTSLQAAEHWHAIGAAMNMPIDLVFIDAGHDYKNAYADIQAWRPLCRLISGHDYDEKFPGVMRAVDELVPNRTLEDNAVWWAYA